MCSGRGLVTSPFSVISPFGCGIALAWLSSLLPTVLLLPIGVSVWPVTGPSRSGRVIGASPVIVEGPVERLLDPSERDRGVVTHDAEVGVQEH